MKTALNKFINKTGIYNMEDLKKDYYAKTSGHWFDAETLRFFQCRISEDLYYRPSTNIIYFVTSEKQRSFHFEHPREYSVRAYNTTNGEIDTVGEFGAHKTLAQAKREAKLLSDENL